MPELTSAATVHSRTFAPRCGSQSGALVAGSASQIAAGRVSAAESNAVSGN
jgi:hypothetical protein